MWGEDCNPEGLSLLCAPPLLSFRRQSTVCYNQPKGRIKREQKEQLLKRWENRQSIGESRHLSAAKWSITSGNWGLQQHLRTLQSSYTNIILLLENHAECLCLQCLKWAVRLWKLLVLTVKMVEHSHWLYLLCSCRIASKHIKNITNSKQQEMFLIDSQCPKRLLNFTSLKLLFYDLLLLFDMS